MTVAERKESMPSSEFSKWIWWYYARETRLTVDQMYMAQIAAEMRRVMAGGKVKDDAYIIKFTNDLNDPPKKKKPKKTKPTQAAIDLQKNILMACLGITKE